jgi:3',5'-cyclic AMP phosphodiesterase CpdA
MSANVIRIAHISDLHFGADGYKDVSKSMAEHLRLSVKPDLLLITGDLVDTPRVIYLAGAFA